MCFRVMLFSSSDGRLRRQGPRHIGEFPQPRQQALRRPSAQGKAAVALQNENRLLLLPLFPLGKLCGQGGGGAVGIAKAMGRAGAAGAVRRPVGAADRGPQLHQRLGEQARLGGVDGFQGLGHGLLHFRGVDGGAVVPQPGYHPQHIPVHGGGGQVEGNGADGPGGVGADAGQAADAAVVPGEDPAIGGNDLLGGLFQISYPAVVAQALPELVQGVVAAGGKGGDIRQGGEKAGIVPLHGLHPGLLEHDLRDPDVVGLPVLPPGKVPFVLFIPGQQPLGQLRGKRSGVHRADLSFRVFSTSIIPLLSRANLPLRGRWLAAGETEEGPYGRERFVADTRFLRTALARNAPPQSRLTPSQLPRRGSFCPKGKLLPGGEAFSQPTLPRALLPAFGGRTPHPGSRLHRPGLACGPAGRCGRSARRPAMP